jgi:hypothetical protein
MRRLECTHRLRLLFRCKAGSLDGVSPSITGTAACTMMGPSLHTFGDEMNGTSCDHHISDQCLLL